MDKFALEKSHLTALAVCDIMRAVSDLKDTELSLTHIYDLELAYVILGQLLDIHRLRRMHSHSGNLN